MIAKICDFMGELITDIIFDCLADAVKDTLWVLPFLLVTYLIMEFIEHRLTKKTQETIKKAGAAGPAIGALLGVIPQCGFSAAASAFYAGRVITLGTLFAVYLSTSDEMLPIFIAGGVPIGEMLSIIGFKLLVGMIFGFIVDFVMRRSSREHKHVHIHDMCARSHCGCHGHSHDMHEGEECHGGAAAGAIIKSACIHTGEVSLFVFLITFVLNLIIAFLGGEEAIASIFSDFKVATVFISGLIGLVPNCAASVVIAQLYVDGVLCIGACMSGLLCAAGVGLLVLLRTNRPRRENFAIIGVLYGVSVLIGLLLLLV